MRKKTHYSSTPSFGYTRPTKIEHEGNLEDYIHCWIIDNENGFDMRSFLIHANNTGYVTITVAPQTIVDDNDTPKEVFGLKRHYQVNEAGYLEISYY